MRAMDLVHNNPQRLQMALQILLTMRGIPQIYYGTEIGISCGSTDHSLIRQDFPGGFPGDARDAFTYEGRTEMENDIFNHLQQLLRLRKEHAALAVGKFVHLPAHDEFYVYFRILEEEKIMMIVNNKAEQRSIRLVPFQHHFQNITSLQDLESQEVIMYSSDLSLDIAGYNVGIYILQ
jgi:glycosidase